MSKILNQINFSKNLFTRLSFLLLFLLYFTVNAQEVNTQTTTIVGKHRVKVFFDPNGSRLAKFAKGKIKPDGEWDILITQTETTNVYKLQFCDTAGNAGSTAWSKDDFGDYKWPATKLYSVNRMPATLAFEDVTFKYDVATGRISNAKGVHAMARPNGNPDGFKPPFITPKQDSDPTAEIVTTEYNTDTSFSIHVYLGFKVPFIVELTKGK